MLKSNRGKSAGRKPLSDISNGGKPQRSCKKKTPEDGSDGSLDRLLLVRSDLSDLIGQIDELVAQALQHKTVTKKGSQEIESFRNVLSNMHTSLKPWFSRLQQAFATCSTASQNQSETFLDRCSDSAANRDENFVSQSNAPELDLIVSPSPLVSWRAGSCTVESGRQLFLLTPLPAPKLHSSKCPRPSKSVVKIFTNKDSYNPHEISAFLTISNNVHNGSWENMEAMQAPGNYLNPSSAEAKSTLESEISSPLRFSNQKASVTKSRRASIILLTPCLKTSVSKSRVLLDPISEPSITEDGGISEPTQKNDNSEIFSDLLAEEVSDPLASRYQELFGVQPASKFTSRRMEIDETLDWFLSPPKTCVLMEPSDDKPLQTPANSAALPGIPTLNDFESTFQKGTHPGETTLKKELWTKFEAVSMDGLHFDATVFKRTARKGFLDMLEEVSCENTDSDSRVSR
ncbi:uncharacterized protein [Typha latifolia]|uniref:uncharacterized protein isoform X2 n=1 Tax=Typha latifolia TaxID=4733 RepID=UPI003C2C3730